MNSPHPTSGDPANPKPRRRWFRFGLRGLILLMLAIGIVFARGSNAAYRNQRAVEAIKTIGGKVYFEPSAMGNILNFVLPHGLSNRPSDSYFETVDDVDFFGSTLTDISMLEDLPNITILCLECTEVTNFSSIGKLRDLKILDLEGTLQNDLSPLSYCIELERVDLPFIESDREPLRGMQNLKYLDLRDLKIDDPEVLLTLKLDTLEIDAASIDEELKKKLLGTHKTIIWTDED